MTLNHCDKQVDQYRKVTSTLWSNEKIDREPQTKYRSVCRLSHGNCGPHTPVNDFNSTSEEYR